MATRKSHLFYGLLIALTSVVATMVLTSRLDLAPRSFAGAMNVPEANSAPLDGPLDAGTFRNIAQQVSPSVVSITVTARRQGGGRSIGDLFGLDQFQPREQAPQLTQGAGSGFIIDEAGYIVTNNHVIRDAERIEIKLAGMDDLEPGLPADIIGRDELTDTALLKLTQLPREPLQAAKFGDSSQIGPGDWVMAIGNPFGLSNTVTVGVVSASGRQQQMVSQRFEEMIQTDAAINPGNSGGPMLNLRGEVVGMNTMILSNNSAGNLGIGFAVPINTISSILPQLRTGKVVRGVLGVQVLRQYMTEAYAKELGLPSPSGAEISLVSPDGPADKGGIKTGDVVVSFNGEPIANNNDLVSQVVRTMPDTTVPVVVYRDRKRLTLNVTVGELDLASEQASVTRGGGRNQPERPEPTDTGFGMTIDQLTPQVTEQLQVPANRGGAVIVSVDQFSPASQAGIGRGDVILRVGNTDVHSVAEVSDALDSVPQGGTTRLILWRAGQGEFLVQIRKR
jgi:serine protease Do